MEELSIERLSATAADDPMVTAAVTELINQVYRDGEKGLWLGEVVPRTTVAEVGSLIRAEEIAVARVGGQIVGSVRIQQLDADTGEFGMLAATSALQGQGIGRRLVAFAEQDRRDVGATVMQLELLVPQGWEHPTKAMLAQWYGRLGYQVVRKGSIENDFPHLAPFLATTCDFLIYNKAL